MEIYRGLAEIKISGKASAVTVGTFDGIHLGHQKILRELVTKASEHDLVPTLVTFDPHPKSVLRAAHRIRVLTTLREKLEAISLLGVERAVVINFTPEFSSMNYEQFIREILLEKVRTKAIVFGYDHAFGKNREGTFKELQKLGETLNFNVCEVGPFTLDSGIVSSTNIRSLIANGDVSRAAGMLGRFYSLSGTVIPGDGRGKLLGFPTANIDPEDANKLFPGDGVYAVDCRIGKELKRGMANIGYKPTFGAHDRGLEVHIFNFEQDLYDQEIAINFIKRLRDERKFENRNQLIEQLKLDRIESMNI